MNYTTGAKNNICCVNVVLCPRFLVYRHCKLLWKNPHGLRFCYAFCFFKILFVIQMLIRNKLNNTEVDTWTFIGTWQIITLDNICRLFIFMRKLKIWKSRNWKKKDYDPVDEIILWNPLNTPRGLLETSRGSKTEFSEPSEVQYGCEINRWANLFNNHQQNSYYFTWPIDSTIQSTDYPSPILAALRKIYVKSK